VLFPHDSSAAPQTVQTASPVCGTKNFSSVRLYSAPQLHRTIVAILGICPRGTPDRPRCPLLQAKVPASAEWPKAAREGFASRLIFGCIRTRSGEARYCTVHCPARAVRAGASLRQRLAASISASVAP
jgi:hypothetical protein